MGRPRLNFRPGTMDLIGIRANDENLMRVTLTRGGAAWDTTGATVAAQARATPQDTAIAVTAVVTAVDETAGAYDVRWPGADVATLLGGEPDWSGVWDLQILPAGATEPDTLLAGTFYAEMDVTRP